MLWLARHAGRKLDQEAVKQNFTLARATALASERTWGQKALTSTTGKLYYLFATRVL